MTWMMSTLFDNYIVIIIELADTTRESRTATGAASRSEGFASYSTDTAS